MANFRTSNNMYSVMEIQHSVTLYLQQHVFGDGTPHSIIIYLSYSKAAQPSQHTIFNVLV
eukprot:COSAG05_NODE_160_length_15590_cov_14.460848_14_plen_60_part_00